MMAAAYEIAAKRRPTSVAPAKSSAAMRHVELERAFSIPGF